jgi:hypothetical protein
MNNTCRLIRTGGLTLLFKLTSNSGDIDEIEPVAFKDFASFGKLEKDLEELIAASILGVLFEDARLMPIFQERQYQAEADIYPWEISFDHDLGGDVGARNLSGLLGQYLRIRTADPGEALSDPKLSCDCKSRGAAGPYMMSRLRRTTRANTLVLREKIYGNQIICETATTTSSAASRQSRAESRSHVTIILIASANTIRSLIRRGTSVA